MTLANTADVEAILQIDIANDVDPKVVALLELATAAVEGEVGRPLDATTYTLRPYSVDYPSNGQLLLDHWPLASVTAVLEDGTTLTVGDDYTVDLDLGILTRVSTGVVIPWTPGPDIITVTYTAAIPPLARAEVARLTANAFVGGAAFAERAAQAGGAMVGLRQLTIGRWSATAETGAGAGTTGIVIDELAARRLASLRSRKP
jgi:hypothetical protein